MVQSALAILEPLPAIDIDDFSKKLEAVFWRDLYAFKSHHSQWWERTSATTWISFLNLAREFEIPMNLQHAAHDPLDPALRDRRRPSSQSHQCLSRASQVQPEGRQESAQTC
jgi:hypothetical protein